ncbi:MAG: hypothetical protein H0U75_06185 [Legionella sp.]|nr:hypothetical protein [Legionella sp.]
MKKRLLNNSAVRFKVTTNQGAFPESPLKKLSNSPMNLEKPEFDIEDLKPTFDEADLRPGFVSGRDVKKVRPPFSSIQICVQTSFQRSTEKLSASTVSKNRKSEHVIYSLCNLNQLLQLLPTSHPSVSKSSLRYVVTLDKQIYFAFEGRPSAFIPEHYKMVSENKSLARCLAAGNIILEREKRGQYCLKIINNKSGDFTPRLDTMKWILSGLLAYQAFLPHQFLPPDIIIEERDISGGVKQLWNEATTSLVTELQDHIELFKKITPSDENKYGNDHSMATKLPHLSQMPIQNSTMSAVSSSGLFSRSASSTEEKGQNFFNENASNAAEELFLASYEQSSFESPVKSLRFNSFTPSPV